MTGLLELAERCERMQGPDREVDAEIAWKQGLRVVDEGHPIGRVCYNEFGRAVPLPFYTKSLDAAMTLFKSTDGYGAMHMFWFEGLKSATVRMFTHEDAETDGVDCFKVTARTLPLAICASALRAKARSADGREGDA